MDEKTNLTDDLQPVRFRGGSIEIDFNFDASHETLWATQAQIAELFGRGVPTISEHISQIYQEGELERTATLRKFRTVQMEGTRQVWRTLDCYNLDMILSVGYRVSSAKATAFRQWATNVLRSYLVEGYALNEAVLLHRQERLEALAAKVRALRADERTVYQKVRDCFAMMAVDYDPNSEESRRFFATIQNKFLYAVTRQVASEIILDRADGNKANMGLNCISGHYPKYSDTMIAKNYLASDELYILHIISEQFLLFAQSAAMRGKKLTMRELSEKFDALLATSEYPVFPGYKEALRVRAMDHAKRELARYQARISP